MVDNDLSSNVLIALRQIMRAVELHSKKLEKNYNLTGPQLILLNQIVKHDGIPMSALAINMSLSNATITGIVDRLEKRGLVERTRGSSDRRQILIKATEIGIETLNSAPSPLQEQFVKRFKELGENGQKTILAALEQIATMMKAEHLEVAPVLSARPLQDDELNNK